MMIEKVILPPGKKGRCDLCGAEIIALEAIVVNRVLTYCSETCCRDHLKEQKLRIGEEELE